MATEKLTKNSLAQIIMSSLRRAITLRRLAIPEKPARKQLFFDLDHTALATSHVVDLGGLLDPTHSEYLTQPICNALLMESRDLMKAGIWRAPFPQTTLIIRDARDGGVLILIHIIESGDTATMSTFIHRLTNVPGGLRAGVWVWWGCYTVDLTSGDVNSDGIPEGEDGTAGFHDGLQTTMVAIALLSRKGDAVFAEPAPFTWTERKPPMGFQKPNPSVSIIRVNTDRILRPPADDAGTGETVRPHDRRAHLRHRGNKLIQVRACKVHGGAPTPTTKIARLAQPLI